MARKVVTHVIDDLDGSDEAEEVRFAFDGVEYTIDLSKKNRAVLDKAFNPYIDAATRVSKNSRPSRGSAKRAGGRSDLAEVREWAKSQGIDVSGRGRIPAALLEQYDAR